MEQFLQKNCKKNLVELMQIKKNGKHLLMR